MKPHKHAELIKAWADGHQIQIFDHGTWLDYRENDTPAWNPEYQYRIKPQETRPDVVEELCLWFARGCVDRVALAEPNVRFTFDGETGKLKSAEVL
jgi:hypothetical protein